MFFGVYILRWIFGGNIFIMQEPVKLVYWAIRGLSERLRQLLEYCGVPYTQERYTVDDREKWFSEIKPKLQEKNPAITLPHLIDGDKVITESDGIAVYISLKAKPELVGRNAEEKVLLATVHGIYKDFHPAYIKLVYGTYNEQNTFENALQEAIKNFAGHLKKLEGLLGEKEFICGGLTWIDFVLADFLQTLGLLHGDILQPFPKLAAYQKRVWGLPELKAYFSSDRFQERPCNGPAAAWK
jgi:glutathione S-transferase